MSHWYLRVNIVRNHGIAYSWKEQKERIFILHKSHFYMSNNVINMNKQHGPFIIPNKTHQRLLNSSEETCICNSGLCFTALCETRGRVWECNEQPTSPRLSAVSLQHLFQHCLFSHGYAQLRLGRMYNPFQQLIGGSASEGFMEKWEDERETGFGLAKSAPCWEELHLRLRQTDRC